MLCTKAEKYTAEWFKVKSVWRFEYPQPESDFKYEQNITYSNDRLCKNRDCGYGLEQVGNFRLRKAPKWKNRSFLMMNWIPDELFVSDEAKNCLKQSGLRGFYFQAVLKKTEKKK